MCQAARRLATIPFIVWGLSSCATTVTADTEADIRQFVAQCVTAVNESDADAFVACFAPSATAFFPSGANAAIRAGHESIRAAIAPTFSRGRPLVAVVPKNLRIEHGGELAYATFEAGTGNSHARRTFVLSRASGTWLIVHLHASNVSE